MKKNLLLLAGSTLLALACLELVFRMFHSVDLPRPRVGVFNGQRHDWYNDEVLTLTKDQHTAFLPNITFQHCYDGPGKGRLEADNCVTYRTNSWGYRDVQHAPKKPAGIFRIAVYGDSFTTGEGVQFDDIFTRRMAAALDTKKIAGKRIEVINLGVPGAYTDDELYDYQDLGPLIQPDWVILQWNTNDFPATQVSRDHMKLIGVEYKQQFENSDKYRWSVLVHYVWYIFTKRQISARIQAVTDADIENAQANLRPIIQMRDEAAKNGARFLVLIFPELIPFDRYPYANIVAAVAGLCEKENIETVNLLPELAKHRAEDLWVHETDHHPNNAAHEIACRAILEHIKTD